MDSQQLTFVVSSVNFSHVRVPWFAAGGGERQKLRKQDKARVLVAGEHWWCTVSGVTSVSPQCQAHSTSVVSPTIKSRKNFKH